MVSGSQSYYTSARQATVTGRNRTSHTITGLTPGTQYVVRVIATIATRQRPDSAPSFQTSAYPSLHPAPGVPGSVTATPAVQSLAVSWTAAANATGYRVQWKSGAQAYNISDRQATTTGTSHTITGLTAGTAYTVRVVAARRFSGDSAPSSEATGTPLAVGVPGSVTATPAEESLAVSWAAAAGATGYKVQWKSGAQAYNTSDRQATATGTSHTITGLAAGTAYTVRVIATRTSAPDSAPSSEATGTPLAVGVPGSVTAAPAVQSLAVSWAAAASANGYKVQWKSGAQAYNTSDRQATVSTGTRYTIPGLAAGTTYTVRVIATRQGADGAPSPEAAGTPYLHPAPGVPGSVTVTPAVQSLVVSWAAVANADDYYVYLFGPYHGSVWVSSGTSHTITGLTPGTEYTVRVRAVRTNAPDGAASSEATGTPYLYPAAGVPGGVAATPALNSLAVSWTAAANANGYKVQWKSGGQSYDTSTRQATTTGTSHTLTGLTAGTAYTVRVVATRTNAPDSAASSEATGTAWHPAPGVPGSVAATPAVGSLAVSWTAAADADGYTVQWKSGSQSYDAARQATASGTSHTITGLAAGTQYTVRVVATRTNAPDGAASSETTGTPTPYLHPAPGAPGSVAAAPAVGSLAVSWTAAADADGYKVQWKSGSQSYDSSYNSARQATATGTSHTIPGLAAGTAYTVRVVATRTNAPDGAPSSEATGTAWHPAPGVPGSVAATPALNSLAVSWSAAADADGYKVQWRSGSQAYDAARQATASGTSHTITGLAAGTEYTVRVVATRTNAPDGAASPEATGIAQYPAPGVPGSVRAGSAAESLVVRWSAGANADGYKVQWESLYDAARQATATGTSHTITGLTGGTYYTVRVVATRTNAPDSASRTVTGFAQHPAPGVPGSVAAAPAVQSLAVSWAAVADADGYEVQWKSGSQSYSSFPLDGRAATTPGTSHTITGLAAGTTYTVRVVATRQGADDGAPSPEATGMPQRPAPGVPGSVTATPALNSLAVSWAAAADADGYEVQWKSGSQSYNSFPPLGRTATTPGTSYTITGLAAGTAYTVRVVATRSNAPDGAASPEAAGTPLHRPAPGGPRWMMVRPAMNGLAVFWGPVSGANGYKVQWKSGAQAYNTSDRQATVSSGTSHTITGLTGGTTYTVRVVATRSNAPDTPPSAEVAGIPYLRPAAGVPGSVAATPAVQSLTVSWAAAANANGYKVQWRSGSQAYDAFSRQATATGTSHTITGLTAGMEYRVRVVATRTNAPDSAPSTEATGTPGFRPAPGVPGSVAATPALNSLVVSWAAAANANGYKVQWKSGAQAYNTSDRQATVSSGTSHTITGLTGGTTYTVRVVATRTNAPDSAPSTEAAGTPPAAGVPGGGDGDADG